MKLKLKFLSLLAGASLMMTSCEDFLDRPSEDALTVDKYLSSESNLMAFTYQIYGPYAWDAYEDKFSWCVGELMPGNVYHNFGDEGQFFYLNFNNTNTILLQGYTSLYNVISRCNMIINEMPKTAKANGLSDDIINRAIGEAKMFRGYAYFLLAEYWGETFIALNNTSIISSDASSTIQKSDRASLYAQIEKDWSEALAALPESRWGTNNERVTKASAAGMLSKLYLTMASCQRELPTNNYVCEDIPGYYQKAIDFATLALGYAGTGFATKENYENIFMERQNPEVIFSLQFETGEYGAGSSRQIQFGRSAAMNNSTDGYGGEKGLSPNLFNSFEAGDVRKKACCYYTENDGDDITLAKGGSPIYPMANPIKGQSEYYYLINPSGVMDDPTFGSEPRGAVLNHCRKFVYNRAVDNKFSCDLTLPILRVTDLYLMRAEAKMGLANTDVTASLTNGIDDINIVRLRAGASPLPSIAFYAQDQLLSENVSDAEGKATVASPYYNYQHDLMGERAMEFALENQSWLDVKRLYYRSEEAAKGFLRERDRAFYYGERLGLSGKPIRKVDFQRQRDIHALSLELQKMGESTTVQAVEPEVDIENAQWFLPLPSKVENAGYPAGVANNVGAIVSGTYPY